MSENHLRALFWATFILGVAQLLCVRHYTPDTPFENVDTLAVQGFPLPWLSQPIDELTAGCGWPVTQNGWRVDGLAVLLNVELSVALLWIVSLVVRRVDRSSRVQRSGH